MGSSSKYHYLRREVPYGTDSQAISCWIGVEGKWQGAVRVSRDECPHSSQGGWERDIHDFGKDISWSKSSLWLAFSSHWSLEEMSLSATAGSRSEGEAIVAFLILETRALHHLV